jgi:ABC-type sugar transport system ATPase subunit
MATVELCEIQHSFAGHPVLRGLNLGIDSGQYVVLLGPSGCGKTTTLRIIAGLQSPDQGAVLLDGKSVAGVAPRDRDVAMVFQHDGLYPHLTVEQSIRFALQGRIPAKEIRSRVDEAIELTKIQAILNRYPSRLSGGELRRAAVAKAIARRTSIRLLDEPLSALDAPVRYGLQDDILRWHATVPGTTIHVTHDGQEAMRMADKIAVIENGNIVQFATPTEVFMKPQSVSVAQAIGSPPINLIETSVVKGKIEYCSPAISVSKELPDNLPDGDVIVGIRPDSLRIVSVDPSGGSETGPNGIVIDGELLRSRQMQRDMQIYVRAGINEILATVPCESSQHASWSVGQLVRLVAKSDDVHLFDANSRQRIETSRVG